MAEIVLVTGAAGFIGRSLAARLAAGGLRVRCLVHAGSDAGALKAAGLDCFEGDLLDMPSLEKAAAGVSAVWHLGALVRPREFMLSRRELAGRFQAVNAQGTENMARAAAAAGVKRFIYFSSISAGGPGVKKEEDEPRPLTVYGRSKLAGELALRRAAAETGLDFVIVRPAMIYGPGAQRWESLFKLIKKGLVPVPGSGEYTPSVCWLENLIDGALVAAEKGAAGSVFNISEEPITLNDLTAALAGFLKVKPVFIRVPEALLGPAIYLADKGLAALGLAAPGLNFLADYGSYKEAVSSWSHDTSRLRALGWKPALPTREAFADTVRKSRSAPL